MSGPTLLVVPADLDMVRCDRVVASVLAVPRSEVRRMIDSGSVTMDGVALRPAQPVAAGSQILVDVPEPEPDLVPQPVAFSVVVTDPDYLVVDKPPGVTVHPGAGTTQPTLAAGLVHRFPELAALAQHRWGLVHRLDRDTSGLLLVALNAAAHHGFQDALRRREISRTYLALVAGVPEAATGTIDAPIGRDLNNPTRQALRHDGRWARTHYRRLAYWRDVSLAEVTLETGRTHQIRVHFAGIGHPVVGDTTYGGRRAPRGDPGRQWLHAWRLGFAHPVSGETVDAHSPLPADLRSSLLTLGDPESGSVEAALLG